MSRWRPPSPASTAIISPAGFQALSAELEQLWRVERPQVTAIVSAAAANGDRSENGDYIYGKRRLAEIDRRVRYLRKRLKEVKIVDQFPTDQTRAYFGASVRLADECQKEISVVLLGPDEIDTKAGKISIDSPLARAILGKKSGDEVQVSTPQGNRRWELLDVYYSSAG